MANTETTKKLTSTVQVREVTNGATVSVLASSGNFATLIDAVDVRMFDKSALLDLWVWCEWNINCEIQISGG